MGLAEVEPEFGGLPVLVDRIGVNFLLIELTWSLKSWLSEPQFRAYLNSVEAKLAVAPAP